MVGADGLRDGDPRDGDRRARCVVAARHRAARRGRRRWGRSGRDAALPHERLELPPPADTVVVGLDLHVTYAKIAEAQRCVLAGARLVASNRDRAYPVEGRLLPGAGTIVAAIEVATGETAVCIGKPEPFLFEEALRRAGERDSAVVIGDSTDYDMVAAHRVGAVGVLILTGLTEESAVEHARGEAVPDRVIRSLSELFALPEFAGV